MQLLKLRANEDERYLRKNKNKIKAPRTAWEEEQSVVRILVISTEEVFVR